MLMHLMIAAGQRKSSVGQND